jgi:hypothetical protein
MLMLLLLLSAAAAVGVVRLMPFWSEIVVGSGVGRMKAAALEAALS